MVFDGADQGSASARVFRRQVHDGTLSAIVTCNPPSAHRPGWHLSISHAGAGKRPGRYPSWDEITDARYDLVPDEVTMALLLPSRAEYVAVHPTTFQLHQIDEGQS